ncbi:hypothetical protein BH09GEM1_BH09GEM1_39410 [soil metagenome]
MANLDDGDTRYFELRYPSILADAETLNNELRHQPSPTAAAPNVE